MTRRGRAGRCCRRVLYRSGQLLDIARLTAAARERGIPIGFDCSHSVGRRAASASTRWGVDFAFWCTYKYLNGGPGASARSTSTGGISARRRGWPAGGATDKERQFDMAHDCDGRRARRRLADRHAAAPRRARRCSARCAIFAEAGIERIRAKSLGADRLPDRLIEASGLTAAPYGYAHRHAARAGPARRPRRGRARRRAADREGAQATRRHPRLPPAERRPAGADRRSTPPTDELWQVVQQLKAIIDSGEYRAVQFGPRDRGLSRSGGMPQRSVVGGL